jgi:hypothetical protein
VAVDFDDLKLCNCAECGREIAAPGQESLLRLLRSRRGGDPIPQPLAGRVAGRPYCPACLFPSRGGTGTESARPPRQSPRGESDGDDPSREKAIRDLEG